METEKFLSGYCRQLDSSRVVEVVAEGGELFEVDCSYGSCVYQSSCPIAREIDTDILLKSFIRQNGTF